MFVEILKTYIMLLKKIKIHKTTETRYIIWKRYTGGICYKCQRKGKCFTTVIYTKPIPTYDQTTGIIMPIFDICSQINNYKKTLYYPLYISEDSFIK